MSTALDHPYGPALDVTGIDRAELLTALVNGTVPPGGLRNPAFLAALLAGSFTLEKAREMLATKPPGEKWRFDYVDGRPLKVTFDGNLLLRPDLYDRDAPGGDGSCARIVAELRERSR